MTTTRAKEEDVALIELDERSGIPLWVQLRNRLMYLIDSGHYSPGEQLPTVRALAAELNVNYHTVNKVYISLEREGYINSKRGRGAFVENRQKQDGDNASFENVIIPDCIRQCLELGMSLSDIENSFMRVIHEMREKDTIN